MTMSTIYHLDVRMSRLLAFDKVWKISDILAALCCPLGLLNCGFYPYFWLIGSGALLMKFCLKTNTLKKSLPCAAVKIDLLGGALKI